MAALEPFEPLATREEDVERGPRGLLLAVRADRYVVALDRVRVVLERPDVTRLPDAPPAVLGLVNVRGEVVPVLDTGAALGVGAQHGAPFLAVVDTASGPVALASAAPPETTVLGEELGGSDLDAGTGRLRLGDAGVATLLDVDALGRVAGRSR